MVVKDDENLLLQTILNSLWRFVWGNLNYYIIITVISYLIWASVWGISLEWKGYVVNSSLETYYIVDIKYGILSQSSINKKIISNSSKIARSARQLFDKTFFFTIWMEYPVTWSACNLMADTLSYECVWQQILFFRNLKFKQNPWKTFIKLALN